MSYSLKVIKDNPIMLLPLDETSGSIAYDISGCGNNGTHSDGIVSGLLPLIPGGVTGTTITNTKYVDCSLVNNYYGQEQVVSFGQAGFSDNDFSMEIWIYPKFNTAENLVFGDQVNDVGISWHNGNIIFKLQSEILEYTVPYYKKAMHIVAVYGVNYMAIYLDGKVVALKELEGFVFTNTYLNISVGPTASSNSYFIVDAPAIYRYALSTEQIIKHYNAGQPAVSPMQVVYPDNGLLYRISDENTKEISSFSYPANRPFNSIIQDGLTYDQTTNSIYMTPTETSESSEVIIIERIGAPTQETITRTKIRWAGDNGISVSTSSDGETYEDCENGKEIPQYADGVPDNIVELYIKIVFSSTDTSRYNPELHGLWLSFYDTNNIYSDNDGSFLAPATGSKIIPGDVVYPLLSRDYRNGLRLEAGNYAVINCDRPVRSIEFFYSRESSGGGGMLFSQSAINLEWLSAGWISKLGISSIYVNGVDQSSATDINEVFAVGEIYHVVVCASEDIEAESDILINSGSAEVCPQALYQNIAVYDTLLDSATAADHYESYVGSYSESVSEDTITVSEEAINVNTNDWSVIRSV